MPDINLREIAAQIPHGQHYFRRHAARFQKILKSLPATRPLTVLEIGVGYGFLAQLLTIWFPDNTSNRLPGLAPLAPEAHASLANSLDLRAQSVLKLD